MTQHGASDVMKARGSCDRKRRTRMSPSNSKAFGKENRLRICCWLLTMFRTVSRRAALVSGSVQPSLLRLLPAHSPVTLELGGPDDLHREEIDDRLHIIVRCLYTVYDPLSHGAECGLHGMIDTFKPEVSQSIIRHRVHVRHYKCPSGRPASWRGRKVLGTGKEISALWRRWVVPLPKVGLGKPMLVPSLDGTGGEVTFKRWQGKGQRANLSQDVTKVTTAHQGAQPRASPWSWQIGPRPRQRA